MASPPRPLQRGGLEVVRLAVGDAELRSLVEQARTSAARPRTALACHADGGWPAPGSPRPSAPEAGLLVLTARGHARHALQQLTGRERQVLALMAQGRSNHAIAELLFVTEHTIEKHIKNIFAALQLAPSRADHRRVLAVLTYLTADTTG